LTKTSNLLNLRCKNDKNQDSYPIPTPKRFYIAPSNYFNIATSAAQALFRLGSGAFVNGYKVEIDDDKGGEYSILTFFGKRIKESSEIMENRPILPIEIYEFEGCPFCRKVK
jgi:hypothetical protein